MLACCRKSPSPLSFPMGQPNLAYAKHLIGQSRLAVLDSDLRPSTSDLRALLPQQLAHPSQRRPGASLRQRRRGHLEMQLPDGWNALNIKLLGFVVDGGGGRAIRPISPLAGRLSD